MEIKKKRNRPEHKEQVQFIKWLEQQKALGTVLRFTATAQETWTSSWAQIKANTEKGVRRGLPDMIVVLQKAFLFIELKRPKKILKNGREGASPSTVSLDQIQWINLLNQFCCVYAFIAYGVEDAKRITQDVIVGAINKPFYELPKKESDQERDCSFAEFLGINERQKTN